MLSRPHSSTTAENDTFLSVCLLPCTAHITLSACLRQHVNPSAAQGARSKVWLRSFTPMAEQNCCIGELSASAHSVQGQAVIGLRLP